jgi:hypothetical protein
MRKIDWSNVPDQQEYKRLIPGGYVAIITGATDVPDKEYIKIEYDIAQGEFADHFQKLFDAKGFWAGKFIKSYSEKSLPFFKGFLTAIQNSNPGFTFDNNEKKLIGKFVGIVLAEEEYPKNDGGIGVRLYVDRPRSVEQIKNGEFEVPPLKKLKGNSNNPFGGTFVEEPIEFF